MLTEQVVLKEVKLTAGRVVKRSAPRSPSFVLDHERRAIAVDHCRTLALCYLLDDSDATATLALETSWVRYDQIAVAEITVRQPETMKHTFSNQILHNHFIKTPTPAGACNLVDLPGDVFLDTEEELNVIGATLWIMSVGYDRMAEKDRPKNREELRKVSRPTSVPPYYVSGSSSRATRFSPE